MLHSEVGCILNSKKKWLLGPDISSQGGLHCSHWLIWRLVGEPLHITASHLANCNIKFLTTTSVYDPTATIDAHN